MLSTLGLNREENNNMRLSQVDNLSSRSDAACLIGEPLRELRAFWVNIEDSPAVKPIEVPPQAIDINLDTISNTLFIPRAPQDSPDTPDTPDSPDVPGSVESPEIPEIPEDSEPTRPPPPPPPTETSKDPDPPTTTRSPDPPGNTGRPDPPPNNTGNTDPPGTTGGSDPPSGTTERPNSPPINTNPPTPSSSPTSTSDVSREPPPLDSPSSLILSSSSNDHLQGWSDVNATPGSPSPTPDGESTEHPTSNDRVNTGAIIGAVIAGVIICAIVAGCLLWRRRRRRRDVPHLVAFSSTGGAGTATQDGDVERAAQRANIADPLAVQAANDVNRLSRSYSDLDLDLNEKERLSQLFAFPSQGLGHHRASASASSSTERSSFVHAPSSVVGRRRDSATMTAIVSDTDTPRQVQSLSPPSSDSQGSSVTALSNTALHQNASALPQSLNEADLNRIAAVVSKMLSLDPDSARTYVVTIRGDDSRTGAAAEDGMGVGCRVEAESVPPPPYGM